MLNMMSAFFIDESYKMSRFVNNLIIKLSFLGEVSSFAYLEVRLVSE